MAHFIVKSRQTLCKCVKFHSVIVCSCRLAQSTACLPSKVENCLHANQVIPKEYYAKWRIERLHPCDNTGRVQGTFVYHSIKRNDVQNLSMLTAQNCFPELWESRLLKEKRKLAVTAWNHERLMEKLLFQYGVKRIAGQETGLDTFIKQALGNTEKEMPLTKAEVGCRNELLRAPVAMMSKMKKTKTNMETANEGPDAVQMENMFTLLCDEFPKFFTEPVNFDLYHKNVAFINGITGITTRGLPMYKSVVFMAKYTLLLCMTQLSVEVLKITKHADDNTIKVRWRIKGEPRLRALVSRRTKGSVGEKFRYLDGFSVFEIGSDGLVHCHRLHKVMPSSPRKEESPLWVLNYLAVLGLLNRRGTGEALGMFECRSTDEGLDSVSQDSSTTPVPC